jgi:uncharacterized protein DUF695
VVPERIPDLEAFSILEGTIDGYRIVATIREGLHNCKSKSGMPWFLGFSTPLSDRTAEGLPTEQETGDLNRWEDILDQNIRSQCQCIFIGRVTWRGNRELLYYVVRPEQVVTEIEKLISHQALRPFAYRYEHDPQWSNVSIYLHVRSG